MPCLNLGVIGPGLIFRDALAPVLKKMQKVFCVKAICARTQETLKKASALFPEAETYLNKDEMLRDDLLDAVVVATPIKLNGTMCIASLEAGKHVFAEKPLAATREQAEKIVRLERETGKTVYMIEHFVYMDKVLAVERVIKEGQIGEPLYADINFHYIIDCEKGTLADYALTPWRIEADYPLGTIMDGGIHYIAVINYLFGMPSKIFSMGTKLRPTYGEYDNIVTTMSFRKKLKVSFSHSSVMEAGDDHFYVWGTKGLAIVCMDRVLIKKYDGTETVMPHNGGDGNVTMWKHFADCVAKNSHPKFSASDALNGLRITEAIDKSLKSGLCQEL